MKNQNSVFISQDILQYNLNFIVGNIALNTYR